MNAIREAAYWKTWYFTRSKFETRARARARLAMASRRTAVALSFFAGAGRRSALGHMADEAQSTHGELT